ncbi:MAG: aminotransferase class I/II-fold pyridoxal phosphate-dependent enzyme [Dehalococcoidales bacterium]|nr:aminotransferase class I/II-fold pyridoxal phosphate-dependent enzyme [Dehalococcoidales bacterium]
MSTDVNRSIEIYKQSIRKEFLFLKNTSDIIDMYSKAIPLPDQQGCLIPVCELHADDPELIELFAKWRAENSYAFPTRFPVTFDGTKSWLRSKLLDVEDRMLFLVLNNNGDRIGHLGWANAVNDSFEMEIDNVVRGRKDIQPGIMSTAMKALVKWAQENLWPEVIFLRVLKSNTHAIQFYKDLGYQEESLFPLRCQEANDTISYIPVPDGDNNPPDDYFVRMVLVNEYIPDPSNKILTAGPSISAREKSYTLDAVSRGWNNHWSDYIKQFENEFANYIGVKYAISTSSCTGALHLALLALGVGPGDEVVVPDITWVATANAVVYTGATPVFADVEQNSWCLDPESFEENITERTKAVIPVHLYGHPARMDKILEIARKHKLFVVEDAAPSIGAKFQGEKTGTFGDFSAFSFQGAKLVVTGEGGMLLTNNDDLYNRVYSLWDQGRTPGTFWINEIGWKYKMSNVQAAIGLGQLERVNELVEAKRRIFSWYYETLHDTLDLEMNRECSWARSIYWMPSILVDNNKFGIDRDTVREELSKRGIDTRSVFPVISSYPMWKETNNPTAKRIGEQGINLPSGVCLKREEVQYICKNIIDVLTNH